MAAIKNDTITRSRRFDSRESGVVKTMVATKPSRANFFNPIINHETGGVNNTAGT